MKLITLICLFICAIVTESRYLQKRDAEHHPRVIGDIYNSVGEENFKSLVLIMLAQDFQKCQLEAYYKTQEEINTFSKHCKDHGDDEECKKPVITQLYDIICKIPNLDDSYSWSKKCCAMQDPERYKCFRENRNVRLEPYQKPDLGAACKEHKEHPKHAFDHYITEIAKRHPLLYPPAVLGVAVQYNTIITECCEAEDKEKCFIDRMTEIKKMTYYIENRQRHTCQILETFPERVLLAKKLVTISQKYPAATFEVVHKLTCQIVHLNKDCCDGNMVECMIERLELTQHTCEHQDQLSNKLKDCCDKPLLERTGCIIGLPNDDVPSDLPKDLKEFVEDENVCKHYEEEKDIFLAKFSYEFSRRHQELSPQSLLRIVKGYKDLLEKCCVTDNPPQCYGTAPELLAAGIQESQGLVKDTCGYYEKLGDHLFQLLMAERYTRKMPQVSIETMLEITSKMTKVGSKCCALPENQRMTCAEQKLELILGDMCEKQNQILINENVRHCCTDSYADRRSCFTKLGPDPSYKPPQLDENTLNLSADLCDDSGVDAPNKRIGLLIRFLKLKNNIAKEKLEELISEFTKVKEQCCVEANHQACFDIAKPALFSRVKDAVEH